MTISELKEYIYNEHKIEYILNEIKRKFGAMLDAGFNTFWETDGGPEEQGNTMLHAWSSFPAHYLPIYYSDK